MPQEFVDVDRDKVLKQGVALNDVYRTIQAFMGGYFINYFNRFGRQWQVYIEAENDDRAKAIAASNYDYTTKLRLLGRRMFGKCWDPRCISPEPTSPTQA